MKVKNDAGYAADNFDVIGLLGLLVPAAEQASLTKGDWKLLRTLGAPGHIERLLCASLLYIPVLAQLSKHRTRVCSSIPQFTCRATIASARTIETQRS